MQAQLANRDGMPRILAEIREQGDLAANPQAIERLNQVLNKEYCTTLGLAHAILKDPGLSAKILRVVNSVAYSVRGEPVSTITRAIVLIGFERVREIATGLLLIEQFTSRKSGNVAVHDNLRRALRCALTAQAISVHVGQVAPEQAYLLGLFSNLGLLWIAAYYPDVLERALALERAGEHTIDEALLEVAGVAPDRVAAEVLRHWSLPDTYVHHFQRRGVATPRGSSTERLSLVADVADEAARAAERGAAPDERLLAHFERTFGVPAQRLSDAITSVDDELRAQARALGISASRDARIATPPRAPGTRPGSGADATRTPGAGSAATSVSAGTAASGEAQAPASVAASPAAGPHRADTALAIDVAIEVTGSILLDDDVNHNLTAVVEGIARSGPFDVVVLALVNPARDRVLARLCWGPGIEEDVKRLDAPLERGAGLLADAVLDVAPRIVASGTPAMLVAPGALAPRIAATSFAIQPLVLRGKAIGVVVAARAGGPAASRADLPVVQMFANLACIALREHVRR